MGCLMNKSEKSILLITPFFAPQSHAAVFRVHKLAKYLPRFGWKPYVITVDINYNYNEDSRLISELPKDVEIIRTRYVEPTLRGVRMLFGGKNRSYSKIKNSILASSAVSGLKKDTGVYDYLLKHYLYCPDHFWTWYYTAIEAAERLIYEKNIKIVYTTALPYTSLELGIELKKTGIKWVADFRDPGTYSKTTSSSVERVLNQQKNIEKRCFEVADVTTGLSSSYIKIFADKYSRSDMVFIPTGVDDDLIPGPLKTENYILFVGEILKEYGDSFFKVYAKSYQNTDVKLKIIGNKHINQSLAEPHIQRHSLAERVEFIDHMPQRELYKYIVKAKACLLIPGNSSYAWTNFAKLVDYIGLKVPVIAMVPNPSEARSVLSESRLGIFLDGDFDSQVLALNNFLNRETRVSANEEFCKKYLASHMTASFVKIFNNLLTTTN